MRARHFLLLVLPLFLSGCATLFRDPNLRIEDDPFSPNVTVRGGQVSFDSPADVVFLRSFVDRNLGTARHQVYVVDHYSGDWRFYTRANGADTRPLEFTEISRDVMSCSGSSCGFVEHFVVKVTEEELRASPEGFSFRVYARSGHDLTLTVSPVQIREQLAAVDSVRTVLAR